MMDLRVPDLFALRGTSTSPLPERKRVPAQAITLVASAYAMVVALMWGAFNPGSGLGYETAFPYMSESGPTWWSGFLYTADPLRIHTNTFYHLSYLLGIALGIRGSFEPYQLIYALLWWGRGMLVFALLRRFWRGNLLVPYVGGALTIVHSSDGALQWVGQLNQFGFIFWMLLGFYFLEKAVRIPKEIAAVGLLLAACFFEYMSLWSYESQLLLILTYPAALAFVKPSSRLRRIAAAGAWYVVPGFYLWLTINKYAASRGATYQESVMRTNWNPFGIAKDWWFNITSSIDFWNWQREPSAAPALTAFLSILAALVFIAAGILILRISTQKSAEQAASEDASHLCILLGAAAVLLALSFPIYLALNEARSLWRTQMLSGIGTGLVWAAAIGLLSIPLRKHTARSLLTLVLGAVIVYFGASSAITKGAFHRTAWERHRNVIVQILRLAPSVKPGTVVLLTGVPRDADPFHHNMWFDFGLRLAYPGVPVAGVYYYDDEVPSPGMNLKIENDHWNMLNFGMPTIVRDTSLANTLVVEWNSSSGAHIAQSVPEYVCQDCNAALYNPANVITDALSPIAVNRYHP